MSVQWYAGIEKANNGYIVRYNGEPDEDGDCYEEVMVLQQREQPLGVPPTESTATEVNDLSELKAFEELLFMLKEHFAVPHGKHRKYYLRVQIMKRNYDNGEDSPVEE